MYCITLGFGDLQCNFSLFYTYMLCYSYQLVLPKFGWFTVLEDTIHPHLCSTLLSKKRASDTLPPIGRPLFEQERVCLNFWVPLSHTGKSESSLPLTCTYLQTHFHIRKHPVSFQCFCGLERIHFYIFTLPSFWELVDVPHCFIV